MIEKWWERQSLQSKREIDKRGEGGDGGGGKPRHVFHLLCCSAFDLSAGKPKEEEEKTQIIEQL